MLMELSVAVVCQRNWQTLNLTRNGTKNKIFRPKKQTMEIERLKDKYRPVQHYITCHPDGVEL